MRQILLTAIVVIIIITPGSARAQQSISSEIAPSGKLRVAMNSGTPVLLMRTSDGKVTGGVALEIGKFIAEKLGVPFELVAYPNSTAYTQSFGKGEWDVGFGAPTPLVAEKADFIVDVVLTDYLFLAGPGREFADAAQVDRPGVKIAVGKDSSSDQFLSRNLKSAELLRSASGSAGVDALREGKADIYAASGSNVYQTANLLPGAKIVPGAFTSDRYMATLPKGRSSEAQATIAEIVKEAKKTGVLRNALEQTGMKGVRAAPD
jgi:polar amino acid transport system substrate-binding protein